MFANRALASCRWSRLSSNVRRRNNHSQWSIGQHPTRTVATGTVKDGKVILEGVALPEGAVVTVLTDDERAAVKLPPGLEAERQAAIDEADAEEGGAGPEFLQSRKRYG